MMLHRPRFAIAVLVMASALLQGCASTGAAGAAADPRDPWEGMNRKVYAFNDTVDTWVVRPVAQAYVDVVPSFMRTGVHNFLGNLSDVWTFVNATLQFKGQPAAESFMRVAVNTTLGLYGLLDVASEARIPKHKEDFGQTLGHWGMGPGPFVVLPLMGPSTVRDTAALSMDWQATPNQYFQDDPSRYSITALRLVDVRSGLLQADEAVKRAALDPYSFVRDAWLQKRENDVYDGNPPEHFDYSDPDAP